MKKVILKNQTVDGKELVATFLPENGMNLCSYKKDNIEVIDQSTWPLFEQRCAGLGALIGPHFHRRHYESLPKVIKENSNEAIRLLQGDDLKKDPFSHGIGRYASWNYEYTENSISAILKGTDSWNGIALKELEGQDFTYKYSATLTTEGLKISMSIVSDTDSIIGIHYYYVLPEKRGRIVSKVQNHYLYGNQKYLIPEHWNFNHKTHELNYELLQDTDFTFHPWEDPTSGVILLETETYSLKTSFQSVNQECAWQLWHPKESAFVCIEPVTSQDPRHPNLSVSELEILLEIL